MGQTTDTLNPKELPEVKRVKTDHSNLHLTKDEFVAKQNRQKEYDARMEAESKRIKMELDAEEKAAAKRLDEEMNGEEEETVFTPKKKRTAKKQETEASEEEV